MIFKKIIHINVTVNILTVKVLISQPRFVTVIVTITSIQNYR